MSTASDFRVEIVRPCALCRAADHRVPAFRTAVPGLVVSESAKLPHREQQGEWLLIHHATGLAFPYQFGDPESAQKAAAAVAPLADWTATDPAYDIEQVEDALRGLGREYRVSSAGDRVQRNEVPL